MGAGGKGAGQAGAAAGQQAAIANQLFQQSGPLRDLLFGTAGSPGTPGSLGTPGIGGRPAAGISDTPGLPGTPGTPGSLGTPGLLQGLLTQPGGIFPSERDTLERQFSRARENILSGGPARGGLQASLLAQNEAERAFGLSTLASMGQQRQIENIFRTGGLVTGQNQLSLGGLGSAAGTFSGLAGQQAALAGQLGQAAGLTAGLSMGGKGAAGAGAGKAAIPSQVTMAGGGAFCWIAAALYGYGTEEFRLARRWIFDEWHSPLATVSRFLYRTFGQRVATWPLALRVLRPWFDLAVQKARR